MKGSFGLVLLLLALVLAFAGQGLFADGSRYVQAVIILGLAVVATWLSAALERKDRDSGLAGSGEAPVGEGDSSVPRRTFFVVLTLLAMSFCLILERRDQAVPLQAAAWAGSVLALVAACWPGAPRCALRRVGRGLVEHRWEALAFVGLTLVGLVLRAYDLESIPGGMHGDEGEWGSAAIALLEGRQVALFSTGWDQHPTLFTYLQAISMAVFGAGIAGLRMISSLTGALMLVVCYAMLRRMFGVAAAVTGTFLLAVSPWHIQFSRLAMNDIQVALLAAMVVYFLYRGCTSRRAIDYCLAGLCFGLSFYFGNKSIMLPPMVILIVVYLAVTKKGYLRGSVGNLVVFAASALLIFAPLGVYYAGHDWQSLLLGRSGNRFILNNLDRAQAAYHTADPLQILRLQVERVILSFHYYADSSFLAFTREPLLDPITAPLYLVGLAYSVYRWRSAPHAFLVIWYAVGIMGSVTSIDPPQAHRMITMVMTPFAFAGLAVDRVRRELGRMAGWGRSHYAWTIVAVFLAMVAYLNLDAYFVRYAPRQPWVDVTTVAKAIRDLGKDHLVFLNGAPELYSGHGTIRFVAHGVPITDLPVIANRLPWREPAAPLAIVMPRGHTQALPALQDWYPGAKPVVQLSSQRETLMSYLEIEKAELESQQGLDARIFAGAECTGEPIVEVPGVRAGLPLAGAPAPPFCAEWTGTLYMPASSPLVLTLIASQRAELLLDGKPLIGLSGGRAEATIEGIAGPHRLSVRAVVTSVNASLDVLWRWSGKAEEPVPIHVLNRSADIHALLGTYYGNAAGDGAPAWRRMDSLLAFRAFPEMERAGGFLVHWRGYLDISSAGRYLFETFSGGQATLNIDGRQVLRNDQVRPEAWRSGQTELSYGRHQIELTYSYQEGWRLMELYWTPPGGSRELVPPHALSPEG